MTEPTAEDLSARLRELSPASTTKSTKTRQPKAIAAIILSSFFSAGVGFSIGYATATQRSADGIAIDQPGWEWLVATIAEQNDVLPRAAERILREKLHLQ